VGREIVDGTVSETVRDVTHDLAPERDGDPGFVQTLCRALYRVHVKERRDEHVSTTNGERRLFGRKLAYFSRLSDVAMLS
jgi:hypothetical protein